MYMIQCYMLHIFLCKAYHWLFIALSQILQCLITSHHSLFIRIFWHFFRSTVNILTYYFAYANMIFLKRRNLARKYCICKSSALAKVCAEGLINIWCSEEKTLIILNRLYPPPQPSIDVHLFIWDEYPSREVGHITNLGHKINYPDKWPKNVVWSDIWIVKETTWHKSVKYRKMSSFKRYLTALYNARFNIYNLNFVIKHDLAIYSKNCVLMKSIFTDRPLKGCGSI